MITTPPVTAPSPQPDQDMQYFAGQNARIYRGRNLKLAVQASGRPVPGLTWRLPSGRRLKSGTSYDRFTVRDDGTLEVSDVRVSDEGTYRAIASNVAGLAKAKSRLSVLGNLIVAYLASICQKHLVGSSSNHYTLNPYFHCLDSQSMVISVCQVVPFWFVTSATQR